MDVYFDQEEFLVIDNGSGFIKAGFSGQDLPRIVMPTVVGSTKLAPDPNTNVQGDEADGKVIYEYGNAAIA
jgi:actin-related protein